MSQKCDLKWLTFSYLSLSFCRDLLLIRRRIFGCRAMGDVSDRIGRPTDNGQVCGQLFVQYKEVAGV